MAAAPGQRRLLLKGDNALDPQGVDPAHCRELTRTLGARDIARAAPLPGRESPMLAIVRKGSLHEGFSGFNGS